MSARLLLAALILGAANTAYLSWRYLAVRHGWAPPGTGLCSWTATIDCDRVLLTPQARAFHVPNAILGWAFFAGCLAWWTIGTRLGPAYRHHIARTLAVWLGIATLLTFWFWLLLLRLDWFCPFCPWSHLLTWIAFGAAIAEWRRSPRSSAPASRRMLAALVAGCVAQFFAWLAAWALFSGA